MKHENPFSCPQVPTTGPYSETDESSPNPHPYLFKIKYEDSYLSAELRPGIFGKVKVKLSLCFFNWIPHHKRVLGEWKYSSTHSLISALDGGEWSASRPGRFTPQGKSLSYPFDRRLGGPQSRSGRGGEEKNSQPPPGIEP
jgi:hypothetical protein